MYTRKIEIPIGNVKLQGILTVPDDAAHIVIFSHGSGSSHLSPRNKYVSKVFQQHGLATLLCDLLDRDEDEKFSARFNIALLTERLVRIIEWAASHEHTAHLTPMLFGASTGSASALRASVQLQGKIQAIVSRGGRPDLAEEVLPRVSTPVLFIVGELDFEVIRLNRQAMSNMSCVIMLDVIAGASHLFEEPGKLELVAETAAGWFLKYSTKQTEANQKIKLTETIQD
jgi:putative phosphoribosyl transferase